MSLSLHTIRLIEYISNFANNLCVSYANREPTAVWNLIPHHSEDVTSRLVDFQDAQLRQLIGDSNRAQT